MEMFALDDEVARLEAMLTATHGAAQLPALVALAWQLRQRDTLRAVALAQAAQALLAAAPPADAAAMQEQQRITARLQLVHGEAKWLFAKLDAAQTLGDMALDAFILLKDDIGCADAHWLLAAVAIDTGNHKCRDTHLEQVAAAAAAQRGGDRLRKNMAEASQARWAVLSNPSAAQAKWGKRFQVPSPTMHPSLAAWVNDFLGLAAHLSSDFAKAITRCIAARDAALASGQLRAAIIACTNIGEHFSHLNDHQSELDWMQRGLDLARPTGWPRNVGSCLMHTAETMRRLHRLDAAQELLRESLVTLAPLANARSYALSLQYLGDLSLDRGDYAAALDAFRRLEERANALNQFDFQIHSQRGQAHAMSHLGQPQAALVAANRGLVLAQQQHDTHRQVLILKVIAAIHAQHNLPAPPEMSAPSPALHYLYQAVELAATIEAFTVGGDLFDTIAHEQAKVGAFDLAYQTALRANIAREKTHNREATNRAVAMQINYQTERTRTESEHHRKLAVSEAKRAKVSQQTSATLARLSAIGQEITAHLDTSAVCYALDRHVHGLLKVSSFAIYLLDPDGLALRRSFCHENGLSLPEKRIDLADPHANSARCARERRELTIKYPPEESGPTLVPGTLQTTSALFAPLSIGEQLLGVISVQTLQQEAYGEREWLIFRSLCAYGAIALDNAAAYRQLQEAQTQLVSQEKMAALGSLVAGIAHELNTPIGNSLVIASTMQGKSATIAKKMQGPGIKRSDLTGFIDDTEHASLLIVRGLQNAADLLHSFKQVAVDRTTAHRRPFNLQQTCGEIVATMMNQIRKSGHVFHQHIANDIVMKSYPGPLGQVITNFINNTLLHAFDGCTNGNFWLTAQLLNADTVQIQFRDDGNGISEANLKRIFDPFFTTKLGLGGSGLGLSISYNIVTSLLNGQITVNSAPGTGTTFTLELPLNAPQAADPGARAV
jgi:signal transduction histidine kinase/tetratricopeptide (TPR) repeat protein